MMGNYLDKWKALFPEVVGGTKRPLEAISDQDEFNTNGFPQFIAQDPVRYDLQNAFLKQFLSNDAWLWVRQQQADQALDRHKDDARAHPNGVSGNAATATKLQTPRTLFLTGKAAGSTTFDGSANAAINVTSVNADTASKLSTARKINITGNASGSAGFDGTSDVSIKVSVSQAAHADKATQDTNGRAFTDTNAYMHISALADSTDFNNVKTTGIYYCTGGTYPNRPHNSWGILTVYSIGTVKQEYRPDNEAVYYTREYNSTNWNAWSKVAASTADNATTADTATKVNATAPNGGAADLVFGTMAANDYARVRVGGSGDDGWLEIATADGGNEPIYVRQYNGPYDWPNGRPGTVTNEAVLLDSNGNTKFPHNVTAANFVGHLAGNADSTDVAKTLQLVGDNGTKSPSTFNWIGKDGQPMWLWGNNDDVNNYVYNPSNFHVAAADSATNADKVDGYHASDLLSKMQGVLPKTAAEVGQFRELVVNDSHQIKLPDGGTWAYFAFCYTSWSGDNSDGEHRIRMSSGIAAGGTVIHTDSYINSGSLRRMTGTSADNSSTNGGAAVGGFCWRIA